MSIDNETSRVLDALEAEAIWVFRETAAAFERPVLLYSIGKDSTVLLHLARKAFHPGPIPFPVMHIDTGWKFRAMYELRDRTAKELGLDLRLATNQEARDQGVTPFSHGAQEFTRIMKTVALRAALDELAQDPRPHSSLKLTAQSAWRLHVGDYRIVYTIDDQEHVVNIVWVGPRKDAYRPS